MILSSVSSDEKQIDFINLTMSSMETQTHFFFATHADESVKRNAVETSQIVSRVQRSKKKSHI